MKEQAHYGRGGINLPYRFYLLQRIQGCVEQASESEQKKFVRYFTESAWLLF
jgi:hypothetical protein